jgi:RND family efflux transporter MFP subunit
MKSTLRRIILIIIPLAVVIVLFFIFRDKDTSQYETAVAARTSLTSEVSVTGKVDPVKSVNLSFEQTGTLAHIQGQVGDTVVAGQIIASLDTSELATELNEAEASRDTAQASLAALVRGTRPEELTVAEQKVTNAQSSLLDAEQVLRDKIRDAYTRVDDAMHSNADTLFSNADTAHPSFKYTISNQQIKIDLENTRVELGAALSAWNAFLPKTLVADDIGLDQYASQTQSYLGKTTGFLDNLAQAISQLSYTNSIPQSSIDAYAASISAARASVSTATANLTSAKEKLSGAMGAVSLAQKELGLAKAGATKEDIDQKTAQVASAQAAITRVNTQIEKSVLRAPFAGVITALPLEAGVVVTPTTIVATVMTTDTLQVIAYIPEIDIADVTPGKLAEITLDAYGDAILFPATVVKVDPAETVLDGVPTYKTTLAFTQPDARIKPGMTANVSILINEHDNVIGVPSRAISFDENNTPIIEILRADGTTETRSITTGLKSFDGKVEVLEGVNEGELVILSTSN